MIHNEKKQLYQALLLSITLHIFIIGICCIGMPSKPYHLPDNHLIQTIDIAPTSKIDDHISLQNSKTTALNNTILKQEDTAIKKTIISPAIKNKKKSPTKSVATNKPKQITKTKKKLITKNANPTKKTTVQKPKNSTKVLKEPTKNKQKVPEDSIDSILKNLQQGSKNETTNKSSTKDSKQTKSQNNNNKEELSLSHTEISLIQKVISDHWTPPSGLTHSQGINLQIDIELAKNGKIVSTKTFITCPPKFNHMCKLLENSAIRALKNIDIIDNLPPKRYNIWKKFTLNYDSKFFNQYGQ